VQCVINYCFRDKLFSQNCTGVEEECNCSSGEVCVSSGEFGRLECEEGKIILTYTNM